MITSATTIKMEILLISQTVPTLSQYVKHEMEMHNEEVIPVKLFLEPTVLMIHLIDYQALHSFVMTKSEMHKTLTDW